MTPLRQTTIVSALIALGLLGFLNAAMIALNALGAFSQ